MRILVRKMSSLGLLKVELIIGTLIMAAAVIGLPVGIALTDVTLMLNPYVLGVIGVGMLLFGLVGYFIFIRPYILYRKLPAVQAETDGEFLYIHSKKEAKIPLAELAGTGTFVHLPFLFSKELVAVLVTHLLSENYGDLDLDIPGYGSYKLRFVSNVQKTSNELIAFINEALTKVE